MIGLMDCNNFFVSCERLFRPDLLTKPVAVLSSNDGCIVSRSIEVKKLGIPMGAPYFSVKNQCEKAGITVFSSNFKLYRDVSDRIMRVLGDEVGACEIYSIDEAFFKLDARVTHEELEVLRKRIVQKTGIPISIGVSKTKTLAKISGDFAKKGTGVHILTDALWHKVAQDITCGAIWGVGRKTAEKMSKYGMYTAHDIVSKDVSFVRNHFGVVGERMLCELMGIPTEHEQTESNSVRQSLSSTRSFHTAVHELPVLESAIGYHVAHLGEKLRSRKLLATHIRVIAMPGRYSDFSFRKGSIDVELPEPTADTSILLGESLRLLSAIFDAEVPYKKAGCIVSGIMPEAFNSRSLFGIKKPEGSSTPYTVVDALNNKFGAGTVRPGVVFYTEKWRANAKLRSPEYTTKWSDIRVVKAA